MPCDFGSPPSISDTERANTNRIAFRLVNVGNSLITSSLAIFVEEVSLVYVAHGGVIGVVSNNFHQRFYHFLNSYSIQYQVTTANNIYSATGSLLLTINDVASVRDIGWEEGSDNITVTTDNEVLLIMPSL